jgi:hypothetical protein
MFKDEDSNIFVLTRDEMGACAQLRILHNRNFVVYTGHLLLWGSDMYVIIGWTRNVMQNDGGDAFRTLVQNIDI